MTFASDESFNFYLQPRDRECFFDDIDMERPGRVLEVFMHAKGDMQVDLTIHGPLSFEQGYTELFENPIRVENINANSEKSSGTHSMYFDFAPQHEGTYAFCIDNRKAHVFPKHIEFNIGVLGVPAKPLLSADVMAGNDQKSEITETEELQAALKALHTIHRGIIDLQKQQKRDRHRLNLHSSLNDSNYNYAFYGSLFETFVFIIVSIFQICFIRRWFASRGNKSKSKF